MTEPELVATEPWYSHPSAAPRVGSDGQAAYRTAANGTRTCYGGWQFEFEGLRPGGHYEVSTVARPEGIGLPRDTLLCEAIWVQAARGRRAGALQRVDVPA